MENEGTDKTVQHVTFFLFCALAFVVGVLVYQSYLVPDTTYKIDDSDYPMCDVYSYRGDDKIGQIEEFMIPCSEARAGFPRAGKYPKE